MGRAITERDWVVVGATPQVMLDLGFRPVGKDFPVFLHPQTQEEYALARAERKIAPGYTGFQIFATPDISLEEDLKRRDLTINAMAQAEDGSIVDPYHGQQDLQAGILRHVSLAFIEDPVRILRVARFAARFGNFTIHPSTLALMQEMVRQGEINALVVERVWQEWKKALTESYPQRFLEVLANCGALEILFPEFSACSQCNAKLAKAAQITSDGKMRFVVLLQALARSQIVTLGQRYRIPNEYNELALLVATYYPTFQQVLSIQAAEIIPLLESLNAFKHNSKFSQFLEACLIIEQQSPAALQKAQYLQEAQILANSVPVAPLLEKGLQGKEIGQALREERIKKLEDILLP